MNPESVAIICDTLLQIAALGFLAALAYFTLR